MDLCITFKGNFVFLQMYLLFYVSFMFFLSQAYCGLVATTNNYFLNYFISYFVHKKSKNSEKHPT